MRAGLGSNMTGVLMKGEIWMQRQTARQKEGHMKIGFVKNESENAAGEKSTRS